MANNAIVGILRVLLQAETAEFTTSMKDAEKTTASLGKSFGKLAGDLSGAGLTKAALAAAVAVEKVGGVSKLTAQELTRVASTVAAATDKMRVMGQTVPPELAKLSNEIQRVQTVSKPAAGVTGELGSAWGLLGRALPIASVAGLTTALVSLASQALDNADQLVTLSDKTGISIENIQRMKVVAGQTGTTLESLTDASYKLGINLSNGTKNATGAVEKLGLSLSSLRAMSPDKQFNTIVAALEKVENATERNALGVALFGKGFASIASAVAGGYTKIAEGADVATDEQVRALEEAGDAWQKFKDSAVTNATLVAGAIVQAINDIERGADSLTNSEKIKTFFTSFFDEGYLKALQRVGEDQRRIAAGPQGAPGRGWIPLPEPPKPPTDYTQALKDAQKEVQGLSAAQRSQLNAALALGADAAKAYAKEIDLSTDALALFKEGQDKAKRGAADQAKQLDASSRAQREYNNWVGVRYIEAEERRLAALEVSSREQREYYNMVGLRRMEDDAALLRSTTIVATYSAAWEPLKAAVQASLAPQEDAISKAIRLAAAQQQAAADLRNLAQAFGTMAQLAGPGGLGTTLQTMGNLINSFSLAKDATATFQGGVAGLVNKTTAGFTQMAAGAVYFGAALMQVSQTTDRLQAALGGLAVGAATGNIWIAMASALVSWAMAGQNAARAANQLRVVLWEQKAALVEQIGVIGDARFAWQGLADEFGRQLVAPTTKDTVKEMAKIVAQLQKNINDTNRDFARLAGDMIRAGYNLPAAFQPTIQRLVDLGVLTQENIDLFAQLTEGTAVDWQKMEEAGKRYGDWMSTELGPAFRQAQQTDFATQIINDFDLLTRGGAEVGSVLFGMREEISKLVQDSIKFGTTIPENMKPWIQELQRSGNLVDENGVALTDIEKLKFGDKVETEFEKITKALEKLIATLDVLAERLKNLPSVDVKVPPGTTAPGPPPSGPPGGEPSPPPPYAAGIFRGQFDPAGSLALLHGTESVVPRSGELAFAERVLGESHAPVGWRQIVVLPMIPVTDPYLAAEEAAQQFARRVSSDNHGMRESIEQIIADYQRTYGYGG